MAIDKIEWHSGAEDFPKSVPHWNGGTHMGMFVDWALSRGLINPRLSQYEPRGAWLLRKGLISGRTLIWWFYDSAFSSIELLNDVGHAFAEAYYDRYVDDFQALFGTRYPTIYHVPYSRVNRRLLTQMLDERFAEWEASAEGVRGRERE